MSRPINLTEHYVYTLITLCCTVSNTHSLRNRIPWIFSHILHTYVVNLLNNKIEQKGFHSRKHAGQWLKKASLRIGPCRTYTSRKLRNLHAVSFLLIYLMWKTCWGVDYWDRWTLPGLGPLFQTPTVHCRSHTYTVHENVSSSSVFYLDC